MPKLGRWYGVMLAIIALDQLTKWLALSLIGPMEVIYVTPFWNWVLAWNPGAAFSFLADQAGWQRWFFTLLALAVCGWGAYELKREAGRSRYVFALILIMAGALGNVIDRLRFGAVIDFIQWHAADYYWPAFNVADSAITIGAVLLMLDQLTAKPVSDI